MSESIIIKETIEVENRKIALEIIKLFEETEKLLDIDFIFNSLVKTKKIQTTKEEIGKIIKQLCDNGLLHKYVFNPKNQMILSQKWREWAKHNIE